MRFWDIHDPSSSSFCTNLKVPVVARAVAGAPSALPASFGYNPNTDSGSYFGGQANYVMDGVKMLENGDQFSRHSGIDVPETPSYTLLLSGISASSSECPTAMDRRVRDKGTHAQDLLVDGVVPTGTLTVEPTLDQTVPLSCAWTLYWAPPTQR